MQELFVYGGMDGERRLSDIWACDLTTFVWTEIVQRGVAPLGRSLHTAVVIDERMIVFGGWVSMEGEEVSDEGAAPQWKCSNDLAAYNLVSDKWEKFGESLVGPGESLPKARAGHAAAVVNSRMYVWSGRDGIRKLMNAQLCCNDMFLLDTKPPLPPTHLQLIRASLEGVEIQWPAIPIADSYVLQVKRVPTVDDRSEWPFFSFNYVFSSSSRPTSPWSSGRRQAGRTSAAAERARRGGDQTVRKSKRTLGGRMADRFGRLAFNCG